MPLERSEVAAVRLGRQIAVVGGFLADGASSPRVDLYAPALDRWTRLPDLPIGVNHAMAAASGSRLFVVGGYAGSLGRGVPQRGAFVLELGSWRQLRLLPEPRAAAGAAIVGGKLYVVGGVDGAGLARGAFALDLGSGRWTAIPGPTPREHLGVTAARGRVYAVAGRTGGIGSNLALVEEYDPASGRWRRLPPVPDPRGGTGAAAASGAIVSAGGEEPEGTIASVYAFDLDRRRWRRLPDLPTPRHGLGVVGFGERVYTLAGGREPGLAVSGVNESLSLS